MNTTPRKAAFAAQDDHPPPTTSGRFIESGRRPRPLMRRYHVAWIADEGVVREFSRIAPATPAFEAAFACLGYGSQIQTSEGWIAIEDLLPGDRVLTSDGIEARVTWIGTMNIVPRAPNQCEDMGTLTRLTEGCIGPCRPASDLLLGPHARLLHRSSDGTPLKLRPARDQIDGETIVQVTPPTPVQAFQISVGYHAAIIANGIDVETFHPGSPEPADLPDEFRSLYRALFPQVSDLESFGPLRWPRMDTRPDLYGAA
ncbi:Hint domain-containing protein [Aestuariibius sp. 2305UL40-4]|uniref:Hint domain-containing protein n=1 Tax=Aestuariibius violaceus TaxID=3234132 RepID=UPI00345E93C0